MARTTNRAGGHQIPPVATPAGKGARPPSPSDPAVGAPHPHSRKPNPPTGGGGHGSNK